MISGAAIIPDQESLPPPDARLINPDRFPDRRIPTPTDERGLVDIPQLITDVKETVDPNYVWPNGLSVHHFYWPAAWYPYDRVITSTENPALFRNLPIHKGLVLRTFENWLHKITLPPEMPEKEIMVYRVDAWLVARDLFRMARTTVQWEKRARRRRELIIANPAIIKEGFNGIDVIGEEIMHEVLEKNFRGFEHQLQKQEKIPEEFRLLDITGTPRQVATDLGKIMTRSSLQLVQSIAA